MGVDASPGPETFIGRYGLVRYNRHLPAWYPRDRPCELGVCRMLRAADLVEAVARKKAALPVTSA